MIPAIRQQTIIHMLKEANTILYLEDLQAALGISTSTLRRDLRELEAKGQVNQLHGGGVKLTQNTPELNITAKLLLNKAAKEKLAAAAASAIEDGDAVFLDPSSTTLEMIPHLVGRPITVITNGIFHINQLVSNHIPSIMVGGNIKIATNSCIGPVAESDMRNYHFNKCFLGANGFSRTSGITNHDINECLIKQLAIQNSSKSFFLLDSSKYNVVTMIKVVDLNVPTVFTDKAFPDLIDYNNIVIM